MCIRDRDMRVDKTIQIEIETLSKNKNLQQSAKNLYSLLRKIKSNGKYERVKPHHSWNSNHTVGRIVLYELTRHSDHHFKSSKKYQVLESIQESPQLPYGYPTSILISFFPPLWFKIMNPLVKQHMGYSD